MENPFHMTSADRRAIPQPKRAPGKQPGGPAAFFLFSIALFGGCLSSICAAADRPAEPKSAAASALRSPHILFAISDDQSAMHVGAYGDPSLNTPAFDRIAREGVLFRRAHAACPSCTPSRSAILTGQYIWQLEAGGILMGELSTKFAVFPRLLEQAGYEIASTGKTWGPGNLQAGGWRRPPTGRQFDNKKLDAAAPGLSNVDYAANFADFLATRDGAKPFCFWFGSSEPHQSYDVGAWRKAGKQLADARLPGYLPDDEVVRGELLDYGLEIEHFDLHLARMLKLLDDAGLLPETLVIVTSDHGNPLPRAKCNLYNAGTQVPLAIRWPGRIPANRQRDEFVSLVDIAPTILEAAGLEIPSTMTGRSLWPLLRRDDPQQLDPTRDFAVTAFERHTICRREGSGYPMRCIRTKEYAYIRNYEPARWPAGDPDFYAAPQGFFGDVDRGATKSFMIARSQDPQWAHAFRLAFGRRPAEELYDVQADVDEVHNLADNPEFAAVKTKLAARLDQFLQTTHDPRAAGHSPWDYYPYHSPGIFENPRWRTEGAALP